MQLMVSVINFEEALVAANAGANILDVKNPSEGSLGAQFPGVIKQVTNSIGRVVKVSAAIGDLPNLPGTASLAALGAATCGIDYLKVGLFGRYDKAEAIFLLQEVRRSLCDFPAVAIIAAGYADAERAGTLNPIWLPSIAASAGISGCMLDTAIKDGHNLFDFIEPGVLRNLALESHANGLLFGLAGALREQDLPVVRRLGADVAGVRTAVCRDRQRTSPLDPEQTRRLCRINAQTLDDVPQADYSIHPV
ncbi:MAG: (5-formylfuran-3-yl)methyl phosphate synthase [Anaerolineaceae bacterium]|nr:(5-formylfuran-3-yl)methyl phosphate synthase [Anaerolineaceae bacterium]